MTIRLKLISSLITVAILPLVGAAFFVLVTVRQLNIGYTENTIQLYVDKITHQLSGRIEAYKSEIKTLAKHSELRQGNFTKAQEFLVDYVKQTPLDFEKLIISDLEGHFYNTEGGNPAQGMRRTFNDSDPSAQPKSIFKRDYFKRTIGSLKAEEPEVYVSNPMISYTTGVKQIVIAYPIINHQGKTIGLLGGALPWSLFDSWLQEFEQNLKTDIPYPVTMTLISRDGYYWYHWNKDKVISAKTDESGKVVYKPDGEKLAERWNILNDPSPAIRQVGKKMLMKESGISKLTEFKVSYFWFYAPIPAADMSLALVIDEDSISFLTKSILLQISTIFLVAIMLALLVTIYLSEQMTRPVKRLALQLNRILRKDADLLQHLEEFNQDSQIRDLLISCIKEIQSGKFGNDKNDK